VFSSLWSYIQPGCRKLDVAEIYNKNKDSVSFTTSIIESVEYARQHGQNAALATISSAPAPPLGVPGGSGRLEMPRARGQATGCSATAVGAQPLP